MEALIIGFCRAVYNIFVSFIYVCIYINCFFRHKDLLLPSDLLQLFFELFKCQDKTLRSFLRDHIVTDLKNTNAKHKDVKLNSSMQNFMYKMINDSHHTAAKMALNIMIDLYKRSVWNDAKTVNVIRSACCRDIEGKLQTTKLTPMALRFFLGKLSCPQLISFEFFEGRFGFLSSQGLY